MYRSLVCLLTLLSVSCSYIGPVEGPPTVPSVLDVPTLGPNLRRSRIPEPNAPYVPVLRPPEVLRAWVVARTNPYGDQLQGYWWHILASDWAFEQSPGRSIQDHILKTSQAPYSELEPVKRDEPVKPAVPAEASSNTAAIEAERRLENRGSRSPASGAAALPEAMKAQILKAIQVRTGGQ